MALYFYLAFLLIFPILGFLSRGETVFTAEKLSAVQMPFEKMAVYLFRKTEKLPLFAGHSRFLRPGAVRADLRTLDPSRGIEVREQCYFIRKIRYLLLFLFLADTIALLLWFSRKNESVIGEGGRLARPFYGEAGSEQELAAEEGENEIGTFLVPIGAQIYSSEETKAMADQAADSLFQNLPGENPSLSEVSENLVMPSKIEGFPFQISWESSRYDLIDSSGNVYSEALGDGERAPVTLTAVMTYEGRRYRTDFNVCVTPRKLTAAEKLSRDIYAAVTEADLDTAESPYLTLPAMVDGHAISWKEPEADSSAAVFALIAIAGLLYYRAADRELHSRVEKRKQQLQMDYPQMLSRLVLLVGAGTSVRSSFGRMAADYERRKKAGKEETSPVYEEILRMVREMETGVSELDAYEHFGQRCGLLSYSRFCSLLSQNLRKGNRELLSALRQEAEEAFENRRNIARKMGEEAGTRLLFPMIIMLAVTMVIIIIPAYRSFTV